MLKKIGIKCILFCRVAIKYIEKRKSNELLNCSIVSDFIDLMQMLMKMIFHLYQLCMGKN